MPVGALACFLTDRLVTEGRAHKRGSQRKSSCGVHCDHGAPTQKQAGKRLRAGRAPVKRAALASRLPARDKAVAVRGVYKKQKRPGLRGRAGLDPSGPCLGS